MRTILDLAIERIYGAALGELAWGEALAAISRAHHADQAILMTPGLAESAGGLWATRNKPTDQQREYVQSAAGSAVERVPAAHSFARLIHDDGDAGMPATLFVIFRDAQSAPFSVDERSSIELTLRHLARAVRLWFGRRESAHGAEAVTGALDAATIIVDANATVLWMNPGATAWVRERRLRVDQKRLVDVDGLEIDLADAIRRTAEGAAFVEVLGAQRDATAEFGPVHLFRGSGWEGCLSACVLIVVRDHAPPAHMACFLARRFRLTAAETDLALALSARKELGEFAAGRGVGISTARTQLQALFAKTGSRKQSDVVSLMERMKPILAPHSSVEAGALSYAWHDRFAKGSHSNE